MPKTFTLQGIRNILSKFLLILALVGLGQSPGKRNYTRSWQWHSNKLGR